MNDVGVHGKTEAHLGRWGLGVWAFGGLGFWAFGIFQQLNHLKLTPSCGPHCMVPKPHPRHPRSPPPHPTPNTSGTNPPHVPIPLCKTTCAHPSLSLPLEFVTNHMLLNQDGLLRLASFQITDMSAAPGSSHSRQVSFPPDVIICQLGHDLNGSST